MGVGAWRPISGRRFRGSMPLSALSAQNMPVHDADAAQHGADDTQIALVSAGNEQVGPGCGAIGNFDRTAVDRALGLAGEALDGQGGEAVLIAYGLTVGPGQGFAGADGCRPACGLGVLIVLCGVQPVYSDTSSNHAIVLATNKANAIAKNWKV